MNKPKRKPGRPYAGGPTPIRKLRVRDEDWALIQKAAEIQGLTVSEFCRTTVLKAARKVIRKHED